MQVKWPTRGTKPIRYEGNIVFYLELLLVFNRRRYPPEWQELQ